MLPLDALVVDIFRIVPESRDRHDEHSQPVDGHVYQRDGRRPGIGQLVLERHRRIDSP
jgi:hypothetical protein